MTMKHKLPYWPSRFFRWYCNPALQESILGDLEEQFEDDIQHVGLNRARRRFAWNVLRFFRRPIIKSAASRQKLNKIGMLKNDIKTSLRIIKREKLYSTINILGLASGFVIAILILIYVQFESSYESYNPEADKIVRITMDYLDGETLIDQDCETYHVLGPMIKEEFPEVVDFARAYGFEFGFEIEGKVFKESKVYAVAPSFLSMFGYPLLHGNQETALTESGHMVLTESAARKYFGKTDVIGETIKLEEKSNAIVVGIIEDSPHNTHLKFNVLFSYISMKKMLDRRKDPWNNNDTYTYLELNKPSSYPRFQDNLAKLSDRLRKEDHIPDERIVSEKISDIHLYSNKSYEPEQNGSAKLVFFLMGVAFLVILIAILNYINLSTAKAMDRAKEAGIRKVIGSSMGQLRVRFFMEAIILNLIAAVLSLIVILAVFDRFRDLTGLPGSLTFMQNTSMWILLGAMVLVSTILSGVFPAFAFGSLKPLDVLKGKFAHSNRGILLRKVLVTTQFAIAIFLLIQTFTANRQLDYMLNKDLGMTAEKVAVISAPPPEGREKSLQSFRSSVQKYPSFKEASFSTTVPGMSTSNMSSTTNIQLDQETRELKNNFFIYQVDSNFFDALGMDIIQGQGFGEASNFKSPIIVNEEALRIWGIANPEEVIHKKSTFWGRENTIIGVVKNFHQLGVKSAHLPMFFVNDNTDADFISVRFAEGNTLDQVAELERIYKEHFPNSPFDFFFLDQNFDAQYRSDRQFREVFTILSGFAILITFLGLFGLASFMVAKRTKEIGIRKVLGASISQIIQLLSREFIILVGFSTVIALPLTYYLIENWLNQYAFRIDMSIWLFLIPTVFVFILTFVTILSKAYQASFIDPVQSLRDE